MTTLPAQPAWGPTGREVYERTYSRKKADGTPETWLETVTRTVDGNLALVPEQYHNEGERDALIELFYNFRAIPAGRHLWMSGVPGRQYLFNCHHAGWDTTDPARHFTFMFRQLMMGGGVGANYSSEYVSQFTLYQPVDLHIVCDPDHPDYAEVQPYISPMYAWDWTGSIDVEDSREGWAEALRLVVENALVMRPAMAPLVLNLSNVRHRGALIKTFGGVASGPGPLAKLLNDVAQTLSESWRASAFSEFGSIHPALDTTTAMNIDHAIATCVVSGNVRRSARMSIKSWRDSDIFDFIHCKEDQQHNWSTNISVEVDDEFWTAVEYPEAHRQGDHATAVLRAISDGMLRNGEPGLYNRSLAQQGEVGQVSSTNPCGEIALEEWENCNLGHINLDAFASDPQQAEEAFRLMARFLVRATFGDIPDEGQREVVLRNRRIGVGFFGYAGWVAKRGVKFSESHKDYATVAWLGAWAEAVRDEARKYAFQLRIPEPVKTTTVAPTGTIAKLAGRSEGLHPIYARYFIRRIRYAADDPQVDLLRATGHNVVPDIYAPNTAVVEFITKDTLVDEVMALGLDPDEYVQSADEVSVRDMLQVQAMVQNVYADNAVSFTINVKPDSLMPEDLMGLLLRVGPDVKGTTVMVDGTRELAPYERLTHAEFLERSIYGVTVDDSYDPDCASGACPVR